MVLYIYVMVISQSNHCLFFCLGRKSQDVNHFDEEKSVGPRANEGECGKETNLEERVVACQRWIEGEMVGSSFSDMLMWQSIGSLVGAICMLP